MSTSVFGRPRRPIGELIGHARIRPPRHRLTRRCLPERLPAHAHGVDSRPQEAARGATKAERSHPSLPSGLPTTSHTRIQAVRAEDVSGQPTTKRRLFSKSSHHRCTTNPISRCQQAVGKHAVALKQQCRFWTGLTRGKPMNNRGHNIKNLQERVAELRRHL